MSIGDWIEVIVIFGLILFMIAVVISFTIVQYVGETEVIITVEDKYIKRNGDYDRYMVSTQEGETFKITDLMFKGKYNSADIYSKLKVGSTYVVKVTGVRWQFWSEFRNINEIVEEVCYN